MFTMIETFTYRDVLPKGLLSRYTFMETGSAAKIADAVCGEAFAEVVGVLERFTLTSQLLLTKGGSRGPIPRIIDDAFEAKGWMEARVDLYKRAYLFPGQNAPTVKDDPLGERANEALISETYQQGYSVDNVKGRLALDVEWNPKDGNLDRDFSAYRAWHEEGLIDVAVLVTRMHRETSKITDDAWSEFITRHPEHAKRTQTVNYRTTTTANYEKARERVLRGDLGTCPILVVGIGEATWDGVPWDGRMVKYSSDDGQMYLVDAFAEDASPVAYAYIRF